MSIERAVDDYVMRNYGHLVLNTTPEFDEESGLWISRLHSDYPILIQDDREKKRRIQFLKVNVLGYVTFTEKLQLVPEKTTTEEDLEGKLTTFLDMWRSYAERVVISATADRVAGLWEVSSALNPIYEIVNFVWDNEYVTLDYFEGDRSRSKSKIKHYLSLLEDLNLLRNYEGRYVAGNLFVTLREQTDYFQDFLTSVYSEVLRKRYPYLKQVVGHSSLETVIHIGNVVYYPELYAREAVPRNKSTLIDEYALEYGSRISAPRLSGYLRKLREIDVIDEENGLYSGTDSLREKMFSIQKEIESPDQVWDVPCPV